MNIFRKSGGVASGSEAKKTIFEANYLVLTIIAVDVCDVYFSCTIFQYMFYTELPRQNKARSKRTYG